MEVKPVIKAKLFCGIIAVSEDLLDTACKELTAIAGAIESKTDIIPFDFTDYYGDEMVAGCCAHLCPLRVRLIRQTSST